MKLINGIYTDAKIFTHNVEETAISQIQSLVNHEVTEGTKVSIMPDVHAGKGTTIGTTISLPEDFTDWKICPNIVGVDINCGVLMYNLGSERVDLERLDKVINKFIPSGFNIHGQAKDLDFSKNVINKLTIKITGDAEERIHKSLGTLGGGNHFIELGVDENGDNWLAVHSGSRNLGVQVAKHHQEIAISELEKANKVDIGSIIENLKATDRHSEIQSAIVEANKGLSKITRSSMDLAFLTGDLLKDYILDMELAQTYGQINRETMLNIIVENMGFNVVDKFDSAHNFIEHENFTNGMIRKGATSAKLGERLVIPLNMRDGSLICEGKGNEDWNNSAPHGAGRLMSRNQAREQLKLEDFKDQMKNVYSSSILIETLDEAPEAYKSAQEIIGYIKETVDIIHLVKPIYNFKAH